ncbi:hypothetical protein D9V37_04520 [Nocardioides mangrovicus]|uniref:Uncharacterized protein n=1 Tax=Nocardioides mangrovicus TaxID=2478913 RepID=A0A3L8P7J8_9ACTN|nr:hypothetical protein [Nocardioides mangrovicus]RLV51181.1 hypothetical protein D9V37_04520 [Nocardioides mangrovicus]
MTVTAPPATDVGEEARAAVHVGLWVSATRCLLTYVVAPALGALGLVLGPVGLVLQLAGALTATAGARRLWRLGHRLRWPYVAVAAAVDAASLTVLVQAVRR